MLKYIGIFIVNLTLTILSIILPMLIIWLSIALFIFPEKSISDICDVLSIAFTIIGGFFAYNKWTESNRIKRAEFINQIIEKLNFDKDMVNAIYKIDYDKNWYGYDFHKSKLERKIDKLLIYLSYVCYISEMKNIKEEEFKILDYKLERTCSSYDVQSYLWNIYHFSKKQGVNCTFQYLIDYGIKKDIINKETFLNPEENYYKRVLE